MTRPRDRAATLRLVVWPILVVLAFVQAYALLHEGGHALAAMAVGGTVRTVDARSWSPRPHAAYDLPGATDGQRAFVTAAGALLPLAIWAALVAVLPRALPPTLALARTFVSLGMLAGLLPWMVLPWRAMHASAPGDDIVRFTQTSGWPPAVVAAAALALMVGGFALLWRRAGGVAQLRELRAMRTLDVSPRAVAWPAGTFVAGVALALALYAALPPAAAAAGDGVPSPPDHPSIADVELAGGAFDGAFGTGVAGSAPVRLYLGFEDVAGGPIRIALTDAHGQEHVLASFGAGTTMGVAASRPTLQLPAGPWAMTLTTAEGTVGRFRVWVDAPP